MKNIWFLFTVLFMVSCSDNDTGSESVQFNPNLLQKVIFYPENADLTEIWNFDADGFLTEITKPDGAIVQNFVYDEHHNLKSSTFRSRTHEFSYDANDRLTSVNGQPVQFDASSNTYWAALGTADPTSEEQIPHRREWKMNASMLLHTETDFITWMQGDYSEIRARISIDDHGNLTSVSDLDLQYSLHTHDTHPNPLRHATMAISKAMPLISENWEPDFRLKFIGSLYNSANNILTQSHYSEDPESSEYEYVYNQNGLPQSAVLKSFYLGNPEGQIQYAKYYYQGDALP